MGAPVQVITDASDKRLEITQTAHAFVAGEAIYNTGTAWAKAMSDVTATAATRVVGAVISANVFRLAQNGDAVPATGLVAGQTVHVSSATAGLAVSVASGAPSGAVYFGPIGEAISATSYRVAIDSISVL